MKIEMKPAGRDTGNTHKIADAPIKPKNVSLDKSGTVKIQIKLGPITTSGDFKGTMIISLSELHQLMGVIEEKKLSLLIR